MKLLVVLALVAFVASVQALSDKEKETLRTYAEACITETSVEKAKVVNMREKAQFDDSDANLKKYTGCMFRKVNFINEAGDLQVDVIKTKIPSDVDQAKAVEVIDSCKDIKKDDPNETSYEVYKCYRTKTVNPIKF